ncbi:MAG: ribonuclease Z [Candidatus Helarchaeota archaeon]
MYIIFLGTAGTIPTRYRNLPGMIINRRGKIFLFDAGEATQIQFIKASISMHKISAIFVSHLHGDHIGGIPGILQSLSLQKRVNGMRIFGPKNLKTYISAILETMNFELTFPIELFEVSAGIIHDEDDFYVKCCQADHKIETLAYGFFEKPRTGKFDPEKAEKLGIPKQFWKILQGGKEIILNNRVIHPNEVLGPERPGRKVVYAVDTRPCEEVLKLAKKVDILIHDGMFLNSLLDKAIEGGHSTALEAAKLAKKAEVKKLVLTHISSRYPNTDELLYEAKKIFFNTEIAYDFFAIELPLHKN